MNQLRWDPTLREWVAYATHRQDRTFLPPAEYCPLCPTEPDGFPNEVPRESYGIVVFENKFPSLGRRVQARPARRPGERPGPRGGPGVTGAKFRRLRPSHVRFASLPARPNDDSTPELDAFVKTAREAGALGARLTSAGFGGCAIALVAGVETDALEDSALRRFEDEGFEEPAFYRFWPAAGAEVAEGLS